MRVKPSALVGIGVLVLYIVIIVVMQKTSGIPYTDFGDSTGNLWRGIVLSLVTGSVVVAGVGLVTGWFGAAMRDQHRTRVGWALLAPALFLLIAAGNLGFTDWAKLNLGFLAAALAMGLFVGFAEEFVCRGMLLVGLRGQLPEVGAWALTCAMFGLMHGINIFLGAPVGSTAAQVVLAGMQGSAFYVLRRHFGSLVWAMVLHGFWDLSIIIHEKSGGDVNVLGLLVWPASILAVVAGFVVARRTAAGPLEDYAHGSSVAATA